MYKAKCEFLDFKIDQIIPEHPNLQLWLKQGLIEKIPDPIIPKPASSPQRVAEVAPKPAETVKKPAEFKATNIKIKR